MGRAIFLPRRGMSEAAVEAIVDGAVDAIPGRDYAARVLSTRPDALIGYWPLDEASGTVAKDWSRQGNNGVIAAAGVAYAAAGIGDGRAGLAFDGNNGYVQIGNAAFAADWNGDVGSMVAWARVDAASRWSDLSSARWVGHVRSSPDTTYYVAFGRDGSAADRLDFRRRSGGAIVQVNYALASPPTDWFMVGMTWNLAATRIDAYYNGENVGNAVSASFTAWGTNPPDSGPCVLYAGSTTLQEWMGAGAHAAVWDGVVLTAQEMRWLGRSPLLP